MKASKIAYKPVGLALGAVSGLIAGAAFKQAWKVLGHDKDAPDATDEDRTWSEVLLAATLQGAIFAAVKAAVDRAGCRHYAQPDRNLARLTNSVGAGRTRSPAPTPALQPKQDRHHLPDRQQSGLTADRRRGPSRCRTRWR